MTKRPIASVLVVEDDPRQLRLYSRALRGFSLTCVTNAAAAVSALREHVPDVILLDHVLAGEETGVDLLPKLKDVAAHVPVVIISGTLDIHGKLAALQGPHAAHYVIEKPVDLDELERTIHTALEECGVGETIRSLRSLERAEKIEANEPERRFTERLARQHELLKQLRRETGRPNISHLARDYRVSRKTILRDLHDLIQRGQLDPAIHPEGQVDPD